MSFQPYLHNPNCPPLEQNTTPQHPLNLLNDSGGTQVLQSFQGLSFFNHEFNQPYVSASADASLNTQLNCFGTFEQETQLTWKDLLHINGNSKGNKQKIVFLRREMFNILLKKLNYSGNPISLSKEKTGIELACDLYNICLCYVEGEFNADLLEVFAGDQTKRSDCFSNLIEVELNGTKDQLSRMNETIKKILIDLAECSKENALLKIRVAELESSKNSMSNFTVNVNEKIGTKRKRADDETGHTNDSFNHLTTPCTSSNSPGSVNESSNQTNTKETAVICNAQKNPTSDNPQTYSGAAKKPSQKIKENCNKKSEKNKPEIVCKVVDGQYRIEYVKKTAKKTIDEDGFTRVERKNRPKHKIVGSAISNVKCFSAVSKPYHYYVGKFRMATTADILRTHISKFEKVIRIQELSTHIGNRTFRTFKVSVESYSSTAMLTCSNWPGNIVVSRWKASGKRTEKENTESEISNNLTKSQSDQRNEKEVETQENRQAANGESSDNELVGTLEQTERMESDNVRNCEDQANLNLASFNCKNFKSNFNTVQKILEMNDIVFIIEHWLGQEEAHLVKMIDTTDFNIVFKSDFSLYESRQGRPFGGKMWLVKKALNIISYTELSNDVSVISIELNDGNSLQIYGGWLKFDDNSTKSFAEFRSNILMLESELKNNREKGTSFILLGDWNADLKRGKRFDKILKNFVENNNLEISDNYDQNQIGYTYRNGNYKAQLDHMMWSKTSNTLSFSSFKVINDLDNFSDHLPISADVKINCKETPKYSENKNFYRFSWENLDFVEKYNKFLDEESNNLNEYFSVYPTQTVVNSLYKDLCKTLICSARRADKEVKSNIRLIRTLESGSKKKDYELSKRIKDLDSTIYDFKVKLRDTNLQLQKDYIRAHISNLRREMRHLNKQAIKAANSKKTTNFEKLFKYNRSRFWREVSKFKKGDTIKSQNLDMSRFELF
ncbi:hypothetical protein BpHYR1_015398 [Brachionus plicatilis]|uniref:Endonuclease/exonuclease/phosphatase domain-containing protein n=1 Tax=Brachionus plicatilis TaxID=10195 RepID=A0A3M7QSF5_BRAPC|nr:hypothetical protein BpHYR1_015398 [Brachionus plicatilis]